jgi:hypothetical protein
MQGVPCKSREFKWPPLCCMLLVTYLSDFRHFSHTQCVSTVVDFWCQMFKVSLLSYFEDVTTKLLLSKTVVEIKGQNSVHSPIQWPI